MALLNLHKLEVKPKLANTFIWNNLACLWKMYWCKTLSWDEYDTLIKFLQGFLAELKGSIQVTRWAQCTSFVEAHPSTAAALGKDERKGTDQPSIEGEGNQKGAGGPRRSVLSVPGALVGSYEWLGRAGGGVSQEYDGRLKTSLSLCGAL